MSRLTTVSKTGLGPGRSKDQVLLVQPPAYTAYISEPGSCFLSSFQPSPCPPNSLSVWAAPAWTSENHMGPVSSFVSLPDGTAVRCDHDPTCVFLLYPLRTPKQRYSTMIPLHVTTYQTAQHFILFKGLSHTFGK